MIEIMVPYNAGQLEKKCAEAVVEYLKLWSIDTEYTLLGLQGTEALKLIKQDQFAEIYSALKARCRVSAKQTFEKGQWNKLVVCEVAELDRYTKELHDLRAERRMLREKIKQMENERIESKELEVVIDEQKIREGISFKLKSTPLGERSSDG